MPVDLSMIGIEGQNAAANRKLVEAQARHMNTLAEKGQVEVEESRRMQALAEEAGATLNSLARGENTSKGFQVNEDDVAGGSYADPLGAIGMVYAMGGAPEKGKEFIEAAAKIRKSESDIRTDKVLTEQRRLENIIKGSNIVASRLGTARNQAEWDAGLDELEASNTMEPENVEKLRKLGYDPDAALFFRDRAISAADQAKLEFDKLKEENDIAEEQGKADRERQRIILQDLRDRETKRHNLAMEKASGKNGGPAVVAPNSDAMKSVKATLKNMIFTDDVTENNPDFEAAATQAASRAQQFIQNNRAMDWDTAVRRAILEAQAKGAYGVEKGTTRWFSKNDPDKTKFKSEAIALPMPKDKKQMQKGKTYMTSRGLAVWNGQAFDPVE